MPPRTTSKPLISVTAQSSTESTQDAYQDSRAQRMSPWPQDGPSLYNSTDSLDSNKAMSLALETAAAQRLADSQGGSVRTSDKAILVSKAEELVKSRCSSIGVQVSSLPSRTPGLEQVKGEPWRPRSRHPQPRGGTELPSCASLRLELAGSRARPGQTRGPAAGRCRPRPPWCGP